MIQGLATYSNLRIIQEKKDAKKICLINDEDMFALATEQNQFKVSAVYMRESVAIYYSFF